MELVEVGLYVRDMERAIRFYRDTVGLELDFESEHWTTFRTGACTLALHATEQRESGKGRARPHVPRHRSRDRAGSPGWRRHRGDGYRRAVLHIHHIY